MQSALHATHEFIQSSGMHENPVFLIVFVVLSYRRLTNQNLKITISSTILTVLIAAACAQLSPLVFNMCNSSISYFESDVVGTPFKEQPAATPVPMPVPTPAPTLALDTPDQEEKNEKEEREESKEKEESKERKERKEREEEEANPFPTSAPMPVPSASKVGIVARVVQVIVEYVFEI